MRDIGRPPANYRDTESKWQKYWERNKIYKFNPKSKKPLYSIDTPPPTVSGQMHIGHAFSYSQTDFIARFQRMSGKNVFYPFGTDDNGLATEKLIQKEKKVSASKMDRDAFIKLCLSTLKELRPGFVQDWKDIGLSADFSINYSTIDNHSRKIAQKTFLNLAKKGLVYRKESPVMWDTSFQTAIAQAELEGVERTTFMNEIKFKTSDGKDLIIATTRPELLGACVSVMINPEDKRAKKLIGKTATTPLYNHKVPIIADNKVDLEKGTGILMCCTFGDQVDMEWYKKYDLPLKMIITSNGKMNKASGKYSGLKIVEARKKIIEDLKKAGLLFKQTKRKQIVQVGERSKEPVEIINSTQWYVKYLDKKSDFLKGMRELDWHPKNMSVRLKNWITGLNWDWSIARQRKFGVPIPVWYGEDGKVYYADKSQLPVDPVKDRPKSAPIGSKLTPEKDVFDTWFTSASSPHLAINLVKSPSTRKKLFPMNLRPQAHDIINFWLFYTLAKSRILHKTNPWKATTISGHVQDPHGRKMSKSLGNIIEPSKILNKFSADALRYFSSSKKLGEDAPFQEKELVSGTKLMNKIWNTARFVFMNMDSMPKAKPTKLELEDRWILSRLDTAYQKYMSNFNNYDSRGAKHEIEMFFLHEFCDFYLEMIKSRIYGDNKNSKYAALWTAHRVLYSTLQLFSPILCFTTEDLYQNLYKKEKKFSSIHLTEFEKLGKKNSEAERLGKLACSIISEIRQYKQKKGISLGAELDTYNLKKKPKDWKKIENVVKRTMRIKEAR